MNGVHTATIIKRDQFEPGCDSFVLVDWFKNSDGVTASKGLLPGKKTRLVHSYYFDPVKFTVEEARKWLKKNEVSFAEFTEAEPEEKLDQMIMPDLEVKLGSRHNKADMETLQKLHGMAHEMIQHLEALGAHPGHAPYQSVKNSDDVPEEWS